MKPDHTGRKEEETVNGTVPEKIGQSLHDKIALRAYDLYLQRGREDGYAEDDWLQAERETIKKTAH